MCAITDKQKVLSWLRFIGEDNKEIIESILEECVKDKSCRAYFVSRFDEDCGMENVYPIDWKKRAKAMGKDI